MCGKWLINANKTRIYPYTKKLYHKLELIIQRLRIKTTVEEIVKEAEREMLVHCTIRNFEKKEKENDDFIKYFFAFYKCDYNNYFKI